MWYGEKFFKYSSGIVLILVIIFLLGQLHFFFEPIQKFIAVLFFPVIVSGFLYYLLRPLLRLAERLRVPRTIAITLIFLMLIVLLGLLGGYTGSLIGKQFKQLIADLPQIINDGWVKTEQFIQTNNWGTVLTGKVAQQITALFQKALPYLTGHILNLVSALSGIAAVLFLVPFILFYFLKDDAAFAEGFTGRIPKPYQDEVVTVMAEMDRILSTYIIGQGILALALGVLSYIGYLIIGVKYPLILALFALITSFIPVFGSIIGVIPAIIIGLAESPWMVVKILILAVVIHFLEGNFISPNLIGKRLKIHPLTIIFLFLVAAALFGLIGILIVVPVYAVVKIVFKSVLKIYRDQGMQK